MSDIRFDGKVALITGAGGGLGRSHALLLASRGAKVVVNDLGGALQGEGQSQTPAQKVVEEIEAGGGEAVANYDSVTDPAGAAAMVQAATGAFGRIDIVINNAGILRDKSFVKMEEADWDSVIAVHLKGAYNVTRAAWPHFREQGFGRVIMTASAAGLYGNFGQANYSSAKMALVGFGQTLAQEGAKYGIHSNIIAPVARSRMTETIMPPELLAKLGPELVSPLVAWLCAAECETNGAVYEVGGGLVTRLNWTRSKPLTVKSAEELSLERLRDAWPAINDMTDATVCPDIKTSLEQFVAHATGQG
jgi:(3R)-3-hydroxyacyl-CoA dehydrogenase / 3a,7a,12a-trihydroxy-5b-cholest-24-enoyl-CoA hydratase / enoyl-CoA hydratase 2